MFLKPGFRHSRTHTDQKQEQKTTVWCRGGLDKDSMSGLDKNSISDQFVSSREQNLSHSRRLFLLRVSFDMDNGA